MRSLRAGGCGAACPARKIEQSVAMWTEYLNTEYRPDRDLQTAIATYLRQRKNELGIQVVVEQRVQVKPTRFRIPDVTVFIGPRAASDIEPEHPARLTVHVVHNRAA